MKFDYEKKGDFWREVNRNFRTDVKLDEDMVSLTYRLWYSIFMSDSFIHKPDTADGMLIKSDIGLYLYSEFKYDWNFHLPSDQAKVLTQVLFSLSRYLKLNSKMPTAIGIGSINTCFAIHTSIFDPYWDADVDWKTPPSAAANIYKWLVQKMVNDGNIYPTIRDVDGKFLFQIHIDDIYQIHGGGKKIHRITAENIQPIYSIFSKLFPKTTKIPEAFAATEAQCKSLFFSTVSQSEDLYKHPTKQALSTEFDDRLIACDVRGWELFKEEYKNSFTPKLLHVIHDKSDRLTSERTKELQGEYYTPPFVVNAAIIETSIVEGLNWYETVPTYDPASGYANLTKNYPFGRLYLSTLNDADLVASKQYNTNAVKWQMNFLNDLYKEALHDKLIQLFEQDGKVHIVIWMNPPWGAAAQYWLGDKSTMTMDTQMYRTMKSGNYGAASNQTFSQFLFRIIELKNLYDLDITLAFFSPTILIQGIGFEKFRSYFFEHFKFETGFIFPANLFEEVSDKFSAMFSVWTSNPQKNPKDGFPFKIMELKDSEFVQTGTKLLELPEHIDSMKGWCKNRMSGGKTQRDFEPKMEVNYEDGATFPVPKIKDGEKKKEIELILSNATTVKSSEKDSCAPREPGEKYIGMLGFPANQESQGQTALWTASSTMGGGFFDEQYFDDNIATFMVLVLFKLEWMNSKDTFRKPDMSVDGYRQWNIDCIIACLFNGQSKQSSLRNIEYLGKTFTKINEFFFMSHGQIEQFANDTKCKTVFNDTQVFKGERFVYEKRLENPDYTFSQDALEVLEAARELVEGSFPFREEFLNNYSQMHLNAWDSGWYQIKTLIAGRREQKDKKGNVIVEGIPPGCPEEVVRRLKEFDNKYKKLCDRLREGITDFKFYKDTVKWNSQKNILVK